MMKRMAKGFTLIEVMVVVVILGILAAFVVPQIMSRPDEAKMVKAQQDVIRLESALDLYRLDNGQYPSQAQGLAALVQKPSMPPVPTHYNASAYLKRLPKDPWGHDYQYRNPGIYGDVDVFSLGADGREGGEGVDNDIGNWQAG
jgi:general secretion pathway protein G